MGYPTPASCFEHPVLPPMYLFSLCPPDHSPAGRMAPEPPGGIPV